MRLITICFIVFLISCETKQTTGTLERIDPRLDELIEPDARIEILAEGMEWSEGPVWVEEKNMLLFSDVPTNTIYQWTEEGGREVYLQPSGNTGDQSGTAGKGSNGLLINQDGQLIICQHGDRRMAIMNASMEKPKADFISLADRYQEKRFNSPNDAAYRSNGDLYFTDPPYGLDQLDADPMKEQAFNGVYRLKSNGEIDLLIDSLTRPNGIALLNDSTLLVANSDKQKARWYAYTFQGDSITTGKIFYEATSETATAPGLPDGLKVSKQGIVFATGPGGIWIFDQSAKILGKITLPMPAANCAFESDEKTLYITADNYLLRLKLR